MTSRKPITITIRQEILDQIREHIQTSYHRSVSAYIERAAEQQMNREKNDTKRNII